MNWAPHIIDFYLRLDPPRPLPGKVQWLHPQLNAEVQEVVKKFYKKFYNDEDQRLVMLGINPGRFGAGVTGVNFTAPRQLKENCGIPHRFKDQSELSAEFIYEMIEAFGGPQSFYSRVFIGSVCPLGLIKEKKNINYYDDRNLLESIEPFIVESMNSFLSGRAYNPVCIAIGGEKNYKYLLRINERYQWFRKIIPLPHPRFIMQYRRRAKENFIGQYLHVLEDSLQGI